MSEYDRGWWQALQDFEDFALMLAKDKSSSSKDSAIAILHARNALAFRHGGWPKEEQA